MPDLIVFLPNHAYSDSTAIFVSWLSANFFVRSADTDSFKISTTDDDLNFAQFTETITDGFVREVDIASGVTVIKGLEHVEGETVKVTSNGSVVGTEVVSNGEITINKSAFTYAVGKSYVATLIPMDIDIEGTGLSTTKRPNRVVINLHETIGGKIGQDTGAMVNIPNVNTLTTDFREISLPGGYTRDTDVVVQQADPLPMTVLGLTYDIGANRD